jgi:hypothetical protein
MSFADAHGVRGLLASSDPYHQAFVPAERFCRVRRIAREVFGPQNFWGADYDEESVRDLERIARNEDRLRAHVRENPPVMAGTAQRDLSRFLDALNPEDPALPAPGWRGQSAADSCATQFRAETIWELHIDPYGNIQTNCGMILGRVPDTSPAEVLRNGPERDNRFVEAVCGGGAIALARLAQREHGFNLPLRVSQTCELCYLARRFLRRHYPEVFGPEEVYGA